MKIGDRFPSWEEFFYCLKEYEDRVYSNYYVRDSKTLESYMKRLKTPRVHFNPALKYYIAFVSCVKGGKNFIPRSKSIRKSRTGRTGCTAFMYLKMSQCGQYLVISKMNETHSHPVSQSLYKASAQQRLNIDEAILRKYSNALVCHANKKVVQSKIFEETGKFLTLKDLTNMRSRVSREAKMSLGPSTSGSEDPNNTGQDPNMTGYNGNPVDNPNNITNMGQHTGLNHLGNSVVEDPNIISIDPNGMAIDETNHSVANLVTIDSNNIEVNNPELCEEFITLNETPGKSLQETIIESVNLLQDVYKCEVHLFADYKKSPAAIYFQDEEMKSMFNSYPEIIFIDSICNLLANEAKTYLIVVEDSNGRGAIVAVGILFNDHRETLDWFFRKFKETNLNSGDINVIMTDKDSTVRSSLRSLFPQVSLQICLFHTLQLFNHEISPNKMGITPEETKLTKTYLNQLANCTSEHLYREIYAEMVTRIPDVVCGYFNRNWETIREEWALYATSRKRSFMNKTNNKVKTLNKFLRSVIEKNSSLQDFIKYFFVTLNSNRTNNMVNASRKLYSVTCDSLRQKQEDTPEKDYENFLTPFAFGKLKPHFEQTMVYNFEVLDEMYYSCHTDEGQVKLSTLSCNCTFFSSMGLPCHHILSLRQCLELSVFDKNLVLPRWTKEYTLTIHNNSSTVTKSESRPNQGISSQEIISNEADISNQDCQSISSQESNEDESDESISHSFHSPNKETYPSHQSSSVPGTPYSSQQQLDSTFSIGQKSFRLTDSGKGFRILRASNPGPSILRESNCGTSNVRSTINVGTTNQLGTSTSNQGLSNLTTSPNQGVSSNSRPSNQVRTSNFSPSTNQELSTSLRNASTNPVDDQDRDSNSTEIVLNGHGFRILRRRVLSKSEKMSRMSEQCGILCNIGSDAKSNVVFEKRMKLLKYLERIWENNEDEKLNEVMDMMNCN